MSFILDALRKSEHERQRQTGPALVESATVVPRARTNRWATAAIALLLINLVAIGVVLLMKSRDEPATATATSEAGPTAVAPTPSTVTAVPQPGAAAPAATAGRASESRAQASITRTTPLTPPMMRPAAPLPVTSGHNPLQEEVAADSALLADEIAERAAAPPQGPPAVQSSAHVRPGTVVYQSLPETDSAPSQSASGAAEGTRQPSNLPRADEMAARTGAPELRLELHVYSTRPAERLVFINSRQYREGETTQEGATVEQITPDGVVMSMNGNRFLLPRD
jgi:general secretion pathway protein B